MINLFVNLYAEKNKLRRQEYAKALLANLDNHAIDNVFVILEDGVHQADYPLERCHIVPSPERPTFQRMFGIANCFIKLDTVSIIANSDIYFDESIAFTREMKASDCYTLLRYETSYQNFLWVCMTAYAGQQLRKSHILSKRNPIITDVPCDGCQDSWIFKGAINVGHCNFYLGAPGCDNHIAYLIKQYGYTITNPSFTIKSWHVHEGSDRPERPTVNGPSLYVKPCELGNAV